MKMLESRSNFTYNMLSELDYSFSSLSQSVRMINGSDAIVAKGNWNRRSVMKKQIN